MPIYSILCSHYNLIQGGDNMSNNNNYEERSTDKPSYSSPQRKINDSVDKPSYIKKDVSPPKK